MPPSLEKLILGSIGLGNSNRFAGGIPTEWGSLTKLKELNMAQCGLNGTLVSDPRYATEPNRRFLTRSPFLRCAGAIPESIGNLTSLQTLNLFNNKLTGA